MLKIGTEIKSKDNTYKIKQFICKGVFGHVYKVIDEENDKIYAMKRLMSDSETYINNFKREIKILNMLNCDNKYLLCYKDSLVDHASNNMFVIFNYIDDSTELSSIIKNIQTKKIIITNKQIITILLCISKGLQGLHSKKIIHLDIKPSNILTNVHTYESVLIDYGMSCVIDNCEDFGGTPYYIAPEIINNLYNHDMDIVYGTCSDIYSLGIIMHLLLNKTNIVIFSNKCKGFTNIKQVMLYRSNLEGNNRMLEGLVEAIKPQFNELTPLILKMVDFNYMNRPNISHVISELNKFYENITD